MYYKIFNIIIWEADYYKLSHMDLKIYINWKSSKITFFKAVYRRHTNFSMESIKQIFNGTPDFGEEVNVNIQRNADLVHRMYLQIKLPEIDISKDNTNNTFSF